MVIILSVVNLWILLTVIMAVKASLALLLIMDPEEEGEVSKSTMLFLLHLNPEAEVAMFLPHINQEEEGIHILIPISTLLLLLVLDLDLMVDPMVSRLKSPPILILVLEVVVFQVSMELVLAHLIH